MLRQRAPLTPISGNRDPKAELTPFQRGLVVGKASVGQSFRSIATSLKCSISTVSDTVLKSAERDKGRSLPRTGRPKLYSKRDVRKLVRIARQKPKLTYKQLKAEADMKCSRRTITRILDTYNIHKWRAAKRPMLTEVHAKARKKWAQEHINWDLDKWKYIIWSDECSVVRGSGKDREWVFRTPCQKWDKEMIEQTPKGKGVSVMVWAAFSGAGGRSELIILDRDFESKKHGYSANSYIKVLEEAIPTLWEPEYSFMQDNAPIHKAKKTLKWFEDQGIPVVEWPPYSPDLNPIEQIWFQLKKLVYEVNPEMDNLSGGEEKVREELAKALKEAWERIDQKYFDALWQSMERRCQAVLRADGWQTKY